MTVFKKAALAVVMIVGLVATAQADPKRLVTVVTSPEPQTQLMAMVLTMQAVQQGAEARILLCGPGGDIALKEAPANVTDSQPPRGMSPQGLMHKIMAAGGKVEVCAIYLPGKEAGPDALIDGIGVAKPASISELMLRDDTAVWSF